MFTVKIGFWFLLLFLAASTLLSAFTKVPMGLFIGVLDVIYIAGVMLQTVTLTRLQAFVLFWVFFNDSIPHTVVNGVVYGVLFLVVTVDVLARKDMSALPPDNWCRGLNAGK